MLSFVLGHFLHKTFQIRYDGSPQLEYFAADDFGCSSIPFSFRSGKWLLRGEKIFVGDINSAKKVLVFFHGAGAGHTAYEREICYFAKKGYLVYAYDNMGCMDSEGTEVGNLAHSILDAEAFFSHLKKDEHYRNQPIVALGHSWGGIAVLRCLHDDLPVTKCCAMAGIVDLAKMYRVLGKLPKWAEGSSRTYLKRNYGKHAVDGFTVIADTKKPFYYVHGENDSLINSLGNYEEISKIAQQNSNVSTMLVKGRGHQCYWTKQGALHFEKATRGYEKFKTGYSLNYELLLDDETVMQSIFDFFQR